MAKIAGSKLDLRISTSPITSASDGVYLDGSSFNRDFTANELNITSFNNDGFEEVINGLKQGKSTLSGFLDTEDASQKMLESAFFNDTFVYIAWFPNGTASTSGAKTAKATVNSFKESADVSGEQTFEASITLSRPTELS